MIPLKQLENHLIGLIQLGLVKVRVEEKGNSLFSHLTTADSSAESGYATLCSAKMKDGDSLITAVMRHLLTADIKSEANLKDRLVEPQVASMLEYATQLNQYPLPRDVSFDYLFDDDNCREVEIFHALPAVPHPGGIPSNVSSLFPGDEWVEEADKEGLFKKVATVLVPKNMELLDALNYAYRATQFDDQPAVIRLNVDSDASLSRSTVIGDVFTCEGAAHVITLCDIEPVKNFSGLHMPEQAFHTGRTHEAKPVTESLSR